MNKVKAMARRQSKYNMDRGLALHGLLVASANAELGAAVSLTRIASDLKLGSVLVHGG
jgi:hypothetical protein